MGDTSAPRPLPSVPTGLPGLVPAAVDAALEVTIAGSFSRAGIALRRRIGPWHPLPRLDGRVVAITGGSSGIGRAAAVALGRLGASVWLVGRDGRRLAEAAGEAGPDSRGYEADIVDPGAAARLAAVIEHEAGHLDGLVHSAGALFPDRRTAPDGSELTVATHVLAPYRLTWCARDLLSAGAARNGRSVIVTVSSGGMYTEAFDLDRLEMGPEDYRGAVAYARAKRAQVILSHEWARRFGPAGVASHAMHPGWVKTPGLDAGLPRLSRLGPMLRRPEEGADTIVWLVARSLAGTGPALPAEGFWHDRRLRGEYYRPRTRPPTGVAEGQGRELWAWCAARTGVGREV